MEDWEFSRHTDTLSVYIKYTNQYLCTYTACISNAIVDSSKMKKEREESTTLGLSPIVPCDYVDIICVHWRVRML